MERRRYSVFSKGNNKFFVWGSVLLLVLGILVVVNLFAAALYRPLVRAKLIELVDMSTAHQYVFNPGEIEINFLIGEVNLKYSSFRINKKTWMLLKHRSEQPANQFLVKVPLIHVMIRDFQNALFYGEVHVHLLEVVNPVIMIENDSLQHGGELHEGVHLRTYEAKRSNSFISSMQIDEIRVGSCSINYTRTKGTVPVFFFHSSGIDLKAGRVLLLNDDFHPFSIMPVLETLNYQLSCKDLDFRRSTGRYIWRAFGLEIDAKANALSIAGVSIQDAQPQNGAGKRGQSDDRISLTSGTIRVFNENIFRVFQGERIHIPRIVVEGVNFTYLSADTMLKTKIYRMPQEFLLAASQRISIDTLDFRHCSINYEEIPAQGGPPGSIRFSESEGLVTHISNDPAEISRNPDLAVLARSRLYGTGQIEAVMHFDLRSSAFGYTLSMGMFGLKQINSITIPLAALSISRGYITRLSYAAEGNDEKLKGRLTITYRNLSIKMLQSDTGLVAKKRLRTINQLANAFFVLDDNPLLNAPVRTVEVSYTRNVHKSFFHYFWKSLLSGIKPSIGLNAYREVEIDRFKSSVARFRSWQHLTRHERMQRRRLRQERRRSRVAADIS